MSFKLEGEKCPVCHAYFFEDDDIVYCPECGAPHHRDCYNAIGHCGLAENHGTDLQYDLVKAMKEKEKKPEPIKELPESKITVRCNKCGEDYDMNAASCPKCGAPNMSKMGGMPLGFDMLGGVPADMDIGEGVTAEEAKRFVVSNPNRYIPKFAAFKAGKKTSWNWMAFLFPSGWLLSRKMYLGGAVAAVLTVALQLLQFPFINAINNLGITGENYIQLAQAITESMSEIGIGAFALVMIGGVLDLVMRVVIALFGDIWYRNYTVGKIKKIRSESQDMDADYRKYGGVNLFAALLGLMAIQYIPIIFFGFL